MREHEVAEKVASMTWRDEPGATYAVEEQIVRGRGDDASRSAIAFGGFSETNATDDPH